MRKAYVYKPRGSGYYRVEWVPLIEEAAGTKRKKRRSAKANSEEQSRAVAELWAQEIDAAHARGEEWTPPEEREAARREPSVAEVVLAWLKAHKAKDARARAQGRQPNTYRTYTNQMRLLRRFLEEHEVLPLDAIPAGRIGADLLVDYYDWLLAEGTSEVMERGRSPATAYKAVEVAVRPFRWAERRDPFRGRVFAPAVPDDVERAPAEAREVPSFAAAGAAVRSARGWMVRPLTLLYYLGLRVNSQVMRLEWRDFDLSRAVLHVRGSLGKSVQERSGRRVPISPHLVTELQTWADEDGIDLSTPPTEGPSRFVVSLTGAQRGPERQVRELRGRDVKRCWLRAEAWKADYGQPAHVFRAVFIEGLLRLRAERDAVSHLVGHEVGTATGRRYARPDVELEEPMRDAVALIPELPLQAVGGTTEAVTPVSVPLPRC